MIYGNRREHKYEINGIKPEIMSEVTTLLHTLYAECNFTKEDFEKMVNLACMSEDDIRKEAIDTLSLLANMMLKDMRDP